MREKKHLTRGKMNDFRHKQIYNLIICTYVKMYVWCLESSTHKQSKNYQNKILNASTLNPN